MISLPDSTPGQVASEGGARGRKAVGGSITCNLGSPVGNTGANFPKAQSVGDDQPSTKPTPEIGLDWLRMVGPVQLLQDVLDLLTVEHGSKEARKGRNFFDNGFRFESTAEVWFTEDAKTNGLCVDVPGEAIGLVGQSSVFSLLTHLELLGFQASRIDIRADWQEHGGGLCDAVEKACKDGQLCHARIYSPIYSKDGSKCVAKGVNIGRRGKEGSGRYVRFYDKGLERGENPEGEWERMEVELTGDPASTAGQILAYQEGQARLDSAWELLIGSVDFRLPNLTAKHITISERPRAAWWSSYVGLDQGVKCSRFRQTPKLDRFIEWARRSINPTVAQMAALTGQEFEDVIWQILGNPPVADDQKRPVVHEYVERWSARYVGSE